MDEPLRRSRCECGWEVSGPADEVVAATIEHGRRVHNMQATPDEVLQRAEIVDDAGSAGTGSAGLTRASPIHSGHTAARGQR